MKKIFNENERIAQQIYASQMLKLQGKIMEKKMSKVSQKIESQSQNISNNNSPAMTRQKSYENLQKVNRTFLNSNTQVTQQKLSSILNVMAGQQKKNKNQSSFSNELIDTVKFNQKLRKNQSMIHIDQQSLALTKNTSFHRLNQSVKHKGSVNSIQNETIQIQKLKEKIKSLLQEQDKNLVQDQKELTFMIKFNQLLNQLLVVLFQDNNYQQPSSTQDSFQNIQIEHFFKRQIQIINQSLLYQNEKKKLETTICSIKKRSEQIYQENTFLQQQIDKQNNEINQLQDQINKLENQPIKQNIIEGESEELKFLIQSQFEAIQKLLQREQLTKIFLKRVGDSSVIEMFEQFLLDVENNQEDDEEEEDDIQQQQQKDKKVKIKKQKDIPNQIIKKYEEPYQQLNLCESVFADDSRVNDSEESSFGYIGKEQATEVSYYLSQQQVIPIQQSKLQKGIKDKLKINMMDVQLAQLAQQHQFQKMKKQQNILPDDLIESSEI